MVAPTPPFKVRALYEYHSEHDDDLKFPEAQIITVTDIEDDDWYIGEYIDSAGTSRSGLFPKNFVEKFEPAPPPRPTRSRTKPAEAIVESSAAEPASTPTPSVPPVTTGAQSGTIEPPRAKETQAELTGTDPQGAVSETTAVSKPSAVPEPEDSKVAEVAATVKKAPPPVAAKSNAFKDRIAAFNKQAAAPVAPFKPAAVSNNFIKKPFVAPPPSRDAYVPPTREAAPQKIYRREEDPEIAERRLQDEEAARQAGLSSQSQGVDGGEEDAPKPIALKDRIAMLQRQQREQAERQASAVQKKDKPSRPPQRRTESHEATQGEDENVSSTGGAEAVQRNSIDSSREPPPVPSALPIRKQSQSALESELFSDGGNDADQSAGGETTEDAAGSQTSVEEDEHTKHRHPAAPTREADVGDEEENDEEDEGEEEVDEEQERQNRLRARMAALSGAGRGGGMFNPMGFNPMAGVGGPPPAKKKAAPTTRAEEEEIEQNHGPGATMPAMRMALPGLGRTRSPDADDMQNSSDRTSADKHEVQGGDDDNNFAPPKRSSTGRSLPPVPVPSVGTAPPVPGGRTSIDSRPAPPPPPSPIHSPTDGSESDDEPPDTSGEKTHSRGPSRSSTFGAVPVPIRPTDTRDPPQSPPTRSQPPPVPTSPRSTMERGPPPPVPSHGVASPQGRAPPPPPPISNTPSRPSGAEGDESGPGMNEDVEGGSDYEDDYDTDIASSAKHKDALTAHNRNESLDDSTTADDASTRSPPVSRAAPPVPSSAPRNVPPPLPPNEPASRRSVDAKRMSQDQARAPPPLPPSRPPIDDDDYDPYRYSTLSAAKPTRMQPPPPPPAHSGAPQLPPVASTPQDDTEDIYAAPSRRSTDRKAPPAPPVAAHERTSRPPPSVPQTHNMPPPPPPQSAQNSSNLAPSRQSFDVDGSMRRSMDQSRPSNDGGFIARDIDLAQGSRWWVQPDTLPPTLQNRRDIFFEIEESSTNDRAGKSMSAKDVFILFQDYSKTHISARFDASNPDNVHLQQDHAPPPDKLRQDQLEDNHSRFGARLASMVASKEGSLIGDGSPQGLVLDLLSQLPGALYPVGTRAYGALVYQNIGNATVAQYDEIRPGDIVSFRNARFQGKHGNLHTKYSHDVGKPDHVGIVAEWDGTKKKIRAWEQGKEDDAGEPEKGKGKKSGKVKVKGESFRLGDLRSGEVRVWRVMGRGWVGWSDSNV